METISRNRCLVTGNSDLEHLYTFKDFPVFMGCVDTKDPSKDLRCDMSWWISKGAGSIQLDPIPALESIYPASHGSGTIGEIWKAHHIEFGEFILKYAGHDILEVGGGHGFLPEYCMHKANNIHWTLIDPNPTCQSSENFKVVKGFFPIRDKKEYDTIVHSHLFEHMLDPVDFCRKIYSELKDNGKLIFSVPNLGEMFEHQYTNILNFEHTFFLNDYFTKYFLELSGFKIIESKLYLKDHSIFYVAKKETGIKSPAFISQYNKNLRLYKDYADYHLTLVHKINAMINKTVGKVYLFGGHVISQFLLAFGIDESRITNIIDNDPGKWNKRLNGTDLTVVSPEVLESDISPVVILRAGTFQKEIKDQLKAINSTVIILD